MPMFDFKCGKCGTKEERFIYPGSALEKKCSICGSSDYKRLFSGFKSMVEYTDSDEHMRKVIDPGISEIYEQIGREAMDHDANTLENVFGTEQIRSTLAESDD